MAVEGDWTWKTYGRLDSDEWLQYWVEQQEILFSENASWRPKKCPSRKRHYNKEPDF